MKLNINTIKKKLTIKINVHKYLNNLMQNVLLLAVNFVEKFFKFIFRYKNSSDKLRKTTNQWKF